MGRAKPYDPAELAISRYASEELERLPDVPGFDTETQRRVNVFVQWAADRCKSASDLQRREYRSMSAHGVCLMTLYAKAHGVSGGKDLSLEDYIDQDFAPTINRDWAVYLSAVSRANAHEQYMRIMGQVGFVSSRVLTGLCYDWFFGDGRAVERSNGRREAPWRSVIRQVYKGAGKGLATPNEENLAVWDALQNLKHARW